MKLIPLTQGLFVQVDDWNYDWLMQWKWCAKKAYKTYYAVRSERVGNKIKQYRMHREILKTPKGSLVDHQDHNGLNNQEINIRNATTNQNMQNQQKFSTNLSGYKGVCQYHSGKNKGLIRAHICIGNKRIHLGYFKSLIAAAQAYNEAAIKAFGEFAWLNKID